MPLLTFLVCKKFWKILEKLKSNYDLNSSFATVIPLSSSVNKKVVNSSSGLLSNRLPDHTGFRTRAANNNYFCRLICRLLSRLAD